MTLANVARSLRGPAAQAAAGRRPGRSLEHADQRWSDIANSRRAHQLPGVPLPRARMVHVDRPQAASISSHRICSQRDEWMSPEGSDTATVDWEVFAGSAGRSQSPVEVNGSMCGGWLAHRECQPGWVADLGLEDALNFRPAGAKLEHPPRVLVLYGSLRERSFSKLLAFEAARILELCGFDVRTYRASGLPLRDPELENHPKVQELRYLSGWSEGQVWSSPEMHGNMTGHFKSQIDWLPLNTGSVRPTQGRTAVVMQVSGGSQSFNSVNSMRLLARWMRMPCCTNQSSVAKAWQEFDEEGRMKPSDYRDRLVDVMEEFAKFTRIMREHSDFLTDRYSERKEMEEKGRLLSQAEKEAAKSKASEAD